MPDSTVFEPAGLGERGSRLWQFLSDGVTAPNELALIDEVARTADRLDELDNIIQGKGVLNLMQFRLDDVDYDSAEMSVTVSFAAPLAEARQQSASLAGLLKTLSSMQGEKVAPKPRQGVSSKPEPLPAGVVSIETPLERMRKRQQMNG